MDQSGGAFIRDACLPVGLGCSMAACGRFWRMERTLFVRLVVVRCMGMEEGVGVYSVILNVHGVLHTQVGHDCSLLLPIATAHTQDRSHCPRHYHGTAPVQIQPAWPLGSRTRRDSRVCTATSRLEGQAARAYRSRQFPGSDRHHGPDPRGCGRIVRRIRPAAPATRR